MRIAFISDIHGNLEAFEAVLKDIDSQKVDAVLCLGDSVGYGADPEAVLKRLWQENIPSLLGNHDAAIYDNTVLAWFNPQATEAIVQTRKLLGNVTVDRIKQAPLHLSFHRAYCVHGFPPDSVHTYLFEVTDTDVARELEKLKEQVVFLGHTHTLGLVAYDGYHVESYPLYKGGVLLDYRKYIVNVGSVGQPRDGNNNAKYVIWDNDTNALDVRFVPYDIKTAADKILKAGLPEFCARRLW